MNAELLNLFIGVRGKGDSRKFACRILHSTAALGPQSPYDPTPKR
jgi:hypothetical protein